MIINLKSQTDLAGLYFVYEGSTNLETNGNLGISHLMEHLVCKNFEHLRDDFEREGIDWNAYTSSNEIVFYFTGLEEYLSKRRMELSDLMSDFNVTKDQFENERKIVLQEYTDYFSDQTESHMLNLGRKLFLDYDPIGLREDLEGLKFMDCLNFFEKQFANPSKIISVSPTTKFEADIQFAKRDIDKQIRFGPHSDAILESRNDYGDKVSLIMVSKIAEQDFAWITFINAMLSSGLSSPLYTEVREKRGLVYYIRCNQSRLNRQGYTTISTQTSQKNVDEVCDAVRSVLMNPSKWMTRERFDTIKEAYKIKLKKEKINRYSNVNYWITPKGWSVRDIMDELDYDKMIDVYKRNFNYNNFYISNDKEEFN